MALLVPGGRGFRDGDGVDSEEGDEFEREGRGDVEVPAEDSKGEERGTRPDADEVGESSPAGSPRVLEEVIVGVVEPGWEKGDFFSPFEARISVSFHSFRLIFGREIISRRVLEEWTLSLTHFIAKLTS